MFVLIDYMRKLSSHKKQNRQLACAENQLTGFYYDGNFDLLCVKQRQ